MACFYVIDENDVCVSDEMCGCINEFNTFKQAQSVAKKVSKKFNGRFSITVAISTVIFEDGKEVEY